MKWCIGLILGMGLVLCASQSQGEWRMTVHRDGATTPFWMADVDSVTFQDVPVFQDMVWIPPGNVRLGQTGIAEPVNDFYLDGFWIDRYEVSNAKYQAFIDAGGYTTEAYWNPVGWAWRVANNITGPDYYCSGSISERPVSSVSWWEADAYCRWMGGRLPTEAEWEKAAKGGCETHGDPGQCDAADTPSYPWGEGLTGPQANYAHNGDPYDNFCPASTPVGYFDGSNHDGYQTINSPSPYGLYDVAGNVGEWCNTKPAPYPYDPNDGRESPPISEEDARAVRGGWAWDTTDVRSAARDCFLSVSTRSIPLGIGFRCARTGL